MVLKTQATKEKLCILDIIQVKNFCSSKDTINKVKTIHRIEKTFTTNIFDKGHADKTVRTWCHGATAGHPGSRLIGVGSHWPWAGPPPLGSPRQSCLEKLFSLGMGHCLPGRPHRDCAFIGWLVFLLLVCSFLHLLQEVLLFLVSWLSFSLNTLIWQLIECTCSVYSPFFYYLQLLICTSRPCPSPPVLSSRWAEFSTDIMYLKELTLSPQDPT